MINTKKAFTLVELLISLAILMIISTTIIITLNWHTQNANNAKIEAGSTTLKNAFLNYLQENSILPQPDWNNNYFKIDSWYAHSGSSDAYWVYGSVTETTLPKKYIDIIPLDPVSNNYYAYWKTIDNKYFEIASILRKDEKSETKLDWTYPWEYWPISLIREYDWPYFVSNWNNLHLPYNPEEHILTAAITASWSNVQITRAWKAQENLADKQKTTLHTWDKITTWNASEVIIYFTDGSISNLKEDSEITFTEINFTNPDKIKILENKGF